MSPEERADALTTSACPHVVGKWKDQCMMCRREAFKAAVSEAYERGRAKGLGEIVLLLGVRASYAESHFERAVSDGNYGTADKHQGEKILLEDLEELVKEMRALSAAPEEEEGTK